MIFDIDSLSGRALDYAAYTTFGSVKHDSLEFQKKITGAWVYNFYPSTNWKDAGKLLEELQMDLTFFESKYGNWLASVSGYDSYGHTPQLAITRCYVKYKLQSSNISLPDIWK